MTTTHRFDPALAAKYDVAGPRYTSYPTAPNFSAKFGEAEYRRHACDSNADPIPKPLSIYVHVPFCSSPCFYCGCNRVITRDPHKAEAYMERLLREIALQSALFDRDRRVTQLHLGGGTPNYLTHAQLRMLMGALDRAFTLEHGPTREFSIEIDPRFADAPLMHELAALGFDRVSFGVQDFDAVVQEAINRIQPLEQTLEVIEAARAAHFRSISLDLIYGLPLQTLEGFAETLDAVVGIRPDRVALYSYAHLPQLFKAQRQIHTEDLPTPATKLALLGLAIDRLGKAGYVYIGMDHFALPDDELVRAQKNGELQRNFQGYSTHAQCDMIGLGMSAIGFVGGAYAQNARDLIGYYAALDAGRLPVAKGYARTEDDRQRAEIIQALMCHGELGIRGFEQRHHLRFADRYADELVRLAPLIEDGLVETDPWSIRVTPKGRLLLRPIAMCFDAHLTRPSEQPAPRYSRVI